MRLTTSLLAIAALSACGGGSGGGGAITTISDIRATDAEGFIILDDPSGNNIAQSSRRIDFGNSYAYGVTSSDTSGISAYADISAPVKNVVYADPPLDTGFATFTGRYGLLGVSDTTQSTDIEEAGDEITLDVDFTEGRITGDADDIAFDMRIENTQDLTGTVTWKGIEGEVVGRVGEFQLLGAFHGNNETGAFAGGVDASE